MHDNSVYYAMIKNMDKKIFDIKLLKKLILVLAGVVIIGFGLSVNIANDWGSDPVTIFAQALSFASEKIGITWFTVGRALIFMNIVVFIILLLIYKLRYVNIGTFAGFCIGFFTDFWSNIFSHVVLANNDFFFKVIWMIVGTVCLAAGIGIYVAVDMGASPLDLISITISEKFKFNYARTRVVCDLLFLVFGWIFGGVVGITTVLCMLLIGPISNFVIRNIQKYLNAENIKEN